MTVTKYPLEDGTELVIERQGYTETYTEEWRREGWIKCCSASMNALLNTGITTQVISDFVSDLHSCFIVEQVATEHRKTELMNQASEFENHNNRWREPTITYSTGEAYISSGAHWVSLDDFIYRPL
jgi:hypothetical protein